MKLNLTPVAFAVCSALPLAAQAAPKLSFVAPGSGQTISGNLYQSSACEVKGSGDIRRVVFYVDGNQLNTESSAPWNCNVDTRKYADGAHTLRAVAYDARGASSATQISVSFRNAAPANAAPSVSFRAPASGAKVSGSISGSACEALATDDAGIKQVQFFLGSTPLNTELSSPYNCSLDTTKFANGAHLLRAVATDAAGAAGAAEISLNIDNGSSDPVSGPTVQFTAPAEGGALGGNVQGPPNCVVTGANIARVMFYLNDVWTNTDGNLDNGLGCWIDTTKYKDGPYTVKAVAYDSAGRTATATRSVVIQNGAAANLPPSVSFKAPEAGATLKGLVNSTTCEAAASDSDGSVTKVDFYMGSTFVNSKAAAPWQCAIDTTRFADGAYKLMAVATDNAGSSATTQRDVTVQNTVSDPGGGSGGGTAISAADIIGSASADALFAQQSGYTAQVIGTYTSAPSIPETGIHGSVLPNGESLRLGKVTDPVDSARRALAFQLAPSDPSTSGSKRAELSFSPSIEHDKVYWVALSAYVHDWGTLSSGDSSVLGTQLHSGDNSRGLSPAFSIVSNGGRTFQVYALHSTSSSPSQGTTTTTRSPQFALPFERWVDFVFKFKLNTKGSGFLQVWMDGTQIVDYQGSLGFNTPGYKDYAKFGYYNWSSAFNSPRKVLLRSPVTVADPTGAKYKPEDLRAFVRAQP